MLSGSIAGGMTAWRGDLWPQVLAAILENAYSDPPAFDPVSAELNPETDGDRLPGRSGR